MAAELGGESPVEPASSPPRLRWWVTAVALAALAVLAVLIFWPSLPLDTLERPEQSLERLVTRDMDFREASRAAPAWERRLYALGFSSGSEARAAAIDWYDELVEAEGSNLAELYRLILLAEDGQTEAVQWRWPGGCRATTGPASSLRGPAWRTGPSWHRPRRSDPRSPRSPGSSPPAGLPTGSWRGWRCGSATSRPWRRRSGGRRRGGPASSGASARSSPPRRCSWRWERWRSPPG